ncbi:hypothetical protein BN903_47 [Halorubrum sp. AJ67]|nr:hypothetical protein BN903_47 [Halorubrum sp. AJ67]
MRASSSTCPSSRASVDVLTEWVPVRATSSTNTNNLCQLKLGDYSSQVCRH